MKGYGSEKEDSNYYRCKRRYRQRIYEIDAAAIEKMGAGSAGEVSSNANYGTEEIVKFESDDFSNELIGEDEIPF